MKIINYNKKLVEYCLLFILLIFLSQISIAQNINSEYSNFDCSKAKQIDIPFPSTTNSFAIKNATLKNQIIFYEHRDQFSFWYKIICTEDKLIDCKITPINSKDSYVLYIYKNNDANFCNNVFYGKIKPLKWSNLINNNEGKETFELSEIQMKVKKNETYYFCILNTSPSNCGHNMRLISGIDTLNINAIHFPCTEEEPETKLIAAKTTTKKVEPLPSQKVISEKVILSVKEENNITKKVDSRIKIKDELSGKETLIESTGQNSYSLDIEKGKSYNVECIATGYKTFDHSIIISDYVNPINNAFDVFLRPLKTGDNFVMDHIYFHPNTYALRNGAEKEMSYLLNYLINNPDVKIELQGYTNGSKRINRNTAYKGKGPEWNFTGSAKKLSKHRADTIKEYLVKQGIDSKRIFTKGLGGEKMIVENPKKLEDIQKNVRVEVMIL